MAIAERRLVWGGIRKLYDAPKPVFFLGGGSIFIFQKYMYAYFYMLIDNMVRHQRQRPVMHSMD